MRTVEMIKKGFLVFGLSLLLAGFLCAQERMDEQVIAQIKIEGFQHSRVMETLAMLTDVHGPRLTNSPNYNQAAQWARDQMAEWGLSNAQLEPWGTFGPGWSVENFSVEMTVPRYNRLIAYPHAWTPSTPGVITGSPMLVEIKGKEDFEKYRGKLKGAIVLRGKPAASAPAFSAPATRLDETQLTEQLRSIDPGQPESWVKDMQGWEKQQEQAREILQFLKDEGIAILLEPSVRSENVVEVAALGYYVGTEPYFPAFVIAREQYAHILRLMDRKIDVTLKLSLTTRFQTDDERGHNVVAEIPGTDPAIGSELVMLGAHLDSWHSGTGAVDNGAGSAVVMESVRILKALGIRPRRTIRIALWGGEEQGYYGSWNYVKNHFGDPMTQELKPEQAKMSGYFNLDNGSGRIRGVHLQGNERVRPIFEDYLEPFQYLEAGTLTTQNTGGTDHLLFNALGIPGFQFIQDPLDYDTKRHHSDLDIYEGAIESDLQQAAVIIASFVYHTAMRDDMLPRSPLPALPNSDEDSEATTGGKR